MSACLLDSGDSGSAFGSAFVRFFITDPNELFTNEQMFAILLS
jgi:hypothetical protein